MMKRRELRSTVCMLCYNGCQRCIDHCIKVLGGTFLGHGWVALFWGKIPLWSVVWGCIAMGTLWVPASYAIPEEGWYADVVQDFLQGFDDTRIQEDEAVEVDVHRSYKHKYKIKIPKWNDREMMHTIMHEIYGKASVVEGDLMWDAKTLRDLNITCGAQEHREHTVIHSLDTADMPGSVGMGLLAKGAMAIHFATFGRDEEALQRRQKIIQVLEADRELRGAFLALWNTFVEEHERAFVALYKKRHPLRMALQRSKLRRQYTWDLSLSETSLYVLELLKKWAVDATLIALGLNAFLAGVGLLHRVPYFLGPAWRAWLVGFLPAFLGNLVQDAPGPEHGLRLVSVRYEAVRSFLFLLLVPSILLRLYYLHKDTLSPYAEAFYHQQRWYAMVKDMYGLVRGHKVLKRLCGDLLDNTRVLVEGGDGDLAHYLRLLETQDLAHFSIFSSFVGKLLKTVGLFERCCGDTRLLDSMYEVSTLAVLVHLAHYMDCAKAYKNGLCYTEFVGSEEHPEVLLDIKGLWNVCMDPNRAVANDVYMDGGEANMFLIFGPNKGGKTAFLKAIPIMAHVYGLSTSLEAKLCRFDAIITYFNIEDGDFVKGVSQYMSELDRLAYVLRELEAAGRERHVLCLVDEPATGTGEKFAKILTGELVKYLIEMYPRGAFFLVTHYRDLRSMESLHPKIRNYTVVVEHLDGENFRYTYKVVPGTPSEEDELIAYKLLGRQKGFPPVLKERIRKKVGS